ncbi:uncharacterized protein DUF1302 [Nitrospirillum amazonense]|uniref:Uncharacterized protein DUF1302 n=2 Tax=Nitrospirillum TaxID=1543705 RepID=A0A560FI08_9PROT|nr:DUF1302 domain-containing protein [Nitrospirillum amazonense]TWB21235.1 uncharacterized protein DUF1302 [Nitrospirillum amazonense]
MAANVFGKSCLKSRILAGVSVAALGTSLFASMPARALDFSSGDLQGSFNTTLTFGGLIRVQERDKNLVGKANGGNASSINQDNGDLNYGTGLVSSTGRMTNELKLDYDNIGFFSRATFLYDPINNDANSTSGARTGAFTLSSTARDQTAAYARLLDAYAYGNFDLGGGTSLSMRVGNQVLSWGESTFIPNGINAINPVDVSALHQPGTELKEVFLPVPMISANLGLTNNLSVEAFYQFKWEKTLLDPAGTYFSSDDSLSPGARYLSLPFGNPLAADSPLQHAIETNGTVKNPILGQVTPIAPFGTNVPRLNDHNGRDDGQFGFGVHYSVPELDDTDFGIFFLKYNNRVPDLSVKVGSFGDFASNPETFSNHSGYFADYVNDIKMYGVSFSTSVEGVAIQGEYSYRQGQPLQYDAVDVLQAMLAAPSVFGFIQTGSQQGAALGAQQGAAAGAAQGLAAATAAYQTAVNQVLSVAAPALVGTNFTALPAPVQATVQAAIAGAGGPASLAAAQAAGQAQGSAAGAKAGATAGATAGAQQAATAAAHIFNTNALIQRLGGIQGTTTAQIEQSASRLFGTTIQGYGRYDISQVQMTFTKDLPPMMGANQVILVGEVGADIVHNMPDGVHFSGTGTNVGGNANFLGLGGMESVATSGFGTEFSWGYRLVARFDYLNAIGGINLMPRVVWEHDVHGTTPLPVGTFIDGRKAVSVGLTATFLDKWSADVNYTNFFGGGDFNLINDRDFISFSVKYSF